MYNKYDYVQKKRSCFKLHANIYVPTLKSLENGEKKTKSQILYSKIMSLVHRMTDRLTDQMNYKLHAH